MSFVLSEEQELIQETAREFVRSQGSIDALRTLRDQRSEPGYDTKLWREMADLGWTGIPFPEEYGGAGLGHAELGIVLEQLGTRLVISPMLSTVVLAGGVILEAGSPEQKQNFLTRIVGGEAVLALAYQETPRHDPWAIATTAREAGGGYVLTGRKTLVLDGAAADHWIVAARTSGEPGEREGLSLFIVDRDTEGVSIESTFLIDSRSAANLSLDGVHLGTDRLLGELGSGAEVLETTFDRAMVAIASEMLGGIQEVFDQTVAYLKEREQFGVKIGSFQALKHRIARVFCEVELTRSIVTDAWRALDEEDPARSKIASTCKARASDTYHLASNESIQLHGGIGVTDEQDIGFFLKRARVCELLLGDSSYQRRRFAELSGY
ncbi:acyl-CoA/acyl-ACP dehydrogenase [Myxococcota bacterium]|nr:acyl-CoA/acyl-ACP dehydrogenase [Myxococcota bacterium]